MVNNVVLMGRLTKDVEIKETESGNLFCNFAIAFDNSVNQACFINCVAFGAVAESMEKFLAKGSRVVVMGALSQRKYQSKDGTMRDVIEIITNSVEFIDFKKTEESPKEEKSQTRRKTR